METSQNKYQYVKDKPEGFFMEPCWQEAASEWRAGAYFSSIMFALVSVLLVFVNSIGLILALVIGLLMAIWLLC